MTMADEHCRHEPCLAAPHGGGGTVRLALRPRVSLVRDRRRRHPGGVRPPADRQYDPARDAAVPGSSVPADPGPTYGVPGSLPSPPKSTALPKIEPGRSLDGVVIAPAPEHERFGTVPPAVHQ